MSARSPVLSARKPARAESASRAARVCKMAKLGMCNRQRGGVKEQQQSRAKQGARKAGKGGERRRQRASKVPRQITTPQAGGWGYLLHDVSEKHGALTSHLGFGALHVTLTWREKKRKMKMEVK